MFLRIFPPAGGQTDSPLVTGRNTDGHTIWSPIVDVCIGHQHQQHIHTVGDSPPTAAGRPPPRYHRQAEFIHHTHPWMLWPSQHTGCVEPAEISTDGSSKSHFLNLFWGSVYRSIVLSFQDWLLTILFPNNAAKTSSTGAGQSIRTQACGGAFRYTTQLQKRFQTIITAEQKLTLG